MTNLSLSLVISYCILSVFLTYQYNQAKCARYFTVDNRNIRLLIRLITFFGIVFQYGFIGYYGYITKWYLAVILFAVGLIIDLGYNLVDEKIFTRSFCRFFCLLSFVIVPLCAYAMISVLPKP